MAPIRPKDERDLLNLPKPEFEPPKVLERETLRADQSSMQLERVGLSLEGSDGKVYVGSCAIHFYRATRLLGPPEYIFAVHTTDITQIPEQACVHGIAELGRALLKRYGGRAPKRNDDYTVRETERKVGDS